ncbi:9922_t:CDS:1, partial [Acaulospora colombiana]
MNINNNFNTPPIHLPQSLNLPTYQTPTTIQQINGKSVQSTLE